MNKTIKIGLALLSSATTVVASTTMISIKNVVDNNGKSSVINGSGLLPNNKK